MGATPHAGSPWGGSGWPAAETPGATAMRCMIPAAAARNHQVAMTIHSLRHSAASVRATTTLTAPPPSASVRPRVAGRGA